MLAVAGWHIRLFGSVSFCDNGVRGLQAGQVLACGSSAHAIVAASFQLPAIHLISPMADDLGRRVTLRGRDEGGSPQWR